MANIIFQRRLLGSSRDSKVLGGDAVWFIDMVAYRQMKDNDIGNIVLHEPRDEFEFEPRRARVDVDIFDDS